MVLRVAHQIFICTYTLKIAYLTMDLRILSGASHSNGIMDCWDHTIQTESLYIEPQIMRKFVRSQQLRSEIALVHPELLSVFPCQQSSGTSSLTDIVDDENETLHLLQYSIHHRA